MIGSSAVTSPLAGRRTSIASPRANVDIRLAVGHDDDLLSPKLVMQDRPHRIRRPHEPLLVARLRSASMSRISSRRSLAIGRNSGESALSDGRRSPSPRSNARMPCTQPRQLNCAMTTVRSETITPSPGTGRSTYRLVSSLRRVTKLMSCTRTRLPPATSWFSSGRTDTSSGPWGLARICPDRPENDSRFAHRTAGGSVPAAIGAASGDGQNAAAYTRSSSATRLRICRTRSWSPDRVESCTESWTVLAMRLARMSRSLTNQRTVRSSTSGNTAYANAARTISSGMMNLRDRRMALDS